MAPKHHLLLLLAYIACGSVTAQIDDLQIPVENDNRFPPEAHLKNDTDIFEGSGDGVIEEPVVITTTEDIAKTTTLRPALEDVESNGLNDSSPIDNADQGCPNQCQCSVEGEDFVVNCAGNDITQFPNSIDIRTTKLYLQNNKLTEVPKEVSTLKNLVVLNADHNLIATIGSGSISELPELVLLNLANNRLIEYPNDLKNSFGLTKLKELDLGGNDMRTSLMPELFSSFNSLEKLTLPTSTSELLENLCQSLKESLETICTGSCAEQSYECLDAPQKIDEGLFDATLPAMIAYSNAIEDNVDPMVSSDKDNKKGDVSTDTLQILQENQILNDANINNSAIMPVQSRSAVLNENIVQTKNAMNDFSLRSAVNEEPVQDTHSNSVDTQKTVPSNDERDVKVGATTQTKTGGVDKSVIGIIVAGMVLVVATITIKKNWSSIRNRFSTSPRPANERVAGNSNGTTPEEVPLQDKSPA